MRSTAAAGEIVCFGAPELVIMVGTETRMMSVVGLTSISPEGDCGVPAFDSRMRYTRIHNLFLD